MTQEQWIERYVRYLSHLGWTQYELESMAFNAWEAMGDEIPEEVASSDLAEMGDA